ncbi:hypothetical protein FQN52_007520 [Onygenales sp. PD_12]|nr:hypothetical protein FQN52_007520 [Onygenales sp. PD_12]
MDARSDNTSPLADGQRLSSSLPPQPWLNLTPSPARPRTRLFDPPPVDDSTLARRTAALRQLNGIPRSFQRKHRQTPSIGSRSTLPPQPVLVRTYSPESDAQARPSTMSRAPGVLANGSAAERPPAQLPSVHDFGIEGILRAIEPDIQSTLDAIAEICGRSRLSLANEYGSHRPPLGEIRASTRSADNGLLPVEEASSSNERLVDENVIILGDDTSTVDGRNPFSTTYRLLENAQQGTGTIVYDTAMPPTWGEELFTPSRTAARIPSADQRRPQPSPRTSEVKPARNSFDWSLLGRDTEPGKGHRRNTSSQPVVSEVHLDAQADGAYHPLDMTWEAYHRETSGETEYLENPAVNETLLRERISFLADLQAWLTWFKNIGQQEGESSTARSAETRLREVLQKQHSISGIVPA